MEFDEKQGNQCEMDTAIPNVWSLELVVTPERHDETNASIGIPKSIMIKLSEHRTKKMSENHLPVNHPLISSLQLTLASVL